MMQGSDKIATLVARDTKQIMEKVYACADTLRTLPDAEGAEYLVRVARGVSSEILARLLIANGNSAHSSTTMFVLDTFLEGYRELVQGMIDIPQATQLLDIL